MGITKSDKIEKARVDEGKSVSIKQQDRKERRPYGRENGIKRNKGINNNYYDPKRGDSANGILHRDIDKNRAIKGHKRVLKQMSKQPKPNLPKSEDTRSNDEIFNTDSKALGGPNTATSKDIKVANTLVDPKKAIKGKKKDLKKWGSDNASGFGAMIGGGTKSNPTIKPTASTSSSVRSGSSTPPPPPKPSVGWGKSEETMSIMKKAEAMIEVFEKLEELDVKAGEILEKARVDEGKDISSKMKARMGRNDRLTSNTIPEHARGSNPHRGRTTDSKPTQPQGLASGNSKAYQKLSTAKAFGRMAGKDGKDVKNAIKNQDINTNNKPNLPKSEAGIEKASDNEIADRAANMLASKKVGLSSPEYKKRSDARSNAFANKHKDSLSQTNKNNDSMSYKKIGGLKNTKKNNKLVEENAKLKATRKTDHKKMFDAQHSDRLTTNQARKDKAVDLKSKRNAQKEKAKSFEYAKPDNHTSKKSAEKAQKRIFNKSEIYTAEEIAIKLFEAVKEKYNK